MFGFSITCSCLEDPKNCYTFGMHYCSCKMNSALCKADDHPCVCDTDSVNCKHTKIHVCVCTMNSLECKSIHHACICMTSQDCKSDFHICTCEKNPEVCKLYICESDTYKTHICTCETSAILCRSTNPHICICIDNVKICKSINKHICTCDLNNPYHCKSLDNHVCGCRKLPYLCKIDEHLCICEDRPYLCNSNEHLCICKIKPYMCKVDYYHECICNGSVNSKCKKIHNVIVDNLFSQLIISLHEATCGSEYREILDIFYEKYGEMLSSQTYDKKLYDEILKRNYISKILETI